MADLDQILKSINTKEKQEKERFKRIEQFDGIRRKERERVLDLLFQMVVKKHKHYGTSLNKYIIFQDDLKEIIEDIKMGK